MRRPKPPIPPIIWRPVKLVDASNETYSKSSGWRTAWSGKQAIRQQDYYRPAVVRTKKSASGWRPPTAFSGNYEVWTPGMPGTTTTAFQSWNNGDPISRISNAGNASSGKFSLTFPSSGMLDRAVVKALAKLKDQKVNLSVAFGERREAANMMVHTVTNIAKSIRNFRGRNPKDWVKVLSRQTGHGQWRNIPNSWLEVQYGWKPLMSDVYGAVEALNAKERDGDAYRATVKAVVKEKFILDTSAGYGAHCYVPVQLRGERGFQVRLDYVLENPLLATLAQLGITNPLELVWELVPYSFVIDWFSPIGSYLSSMDAALGWKFIGGTNTAFTRQQGSGVPKMHPSYTKGSYAEYIQSTNAKYETNQFAFNRATYSSSPLPRFPGIKNPLSTGHIANAMSLLVSAFR